MRLWIRDITVDDDFPIELPQEDITHVLNKEHEYIILDEGMGLNLDSFTSVNEVNSFLLFCKENDISNETLKVLSAYCGDFYNLKATIESEDYVIINFDDKTSGWGYGHGGDANDPNQLGMVLFDEGYVRLPFEYKEEYESYINWETLWNEASTGDGWKRVLVCDGQNRINYLVK